MQFTAAHIRQACALLGWKSAMLSRRAKVPFQAAWMSRQEEMIKAVPGMDLWAIRRALEAASVRFSVNIHGRPDVSLTPPS